MRTSRTNRHFLCAPRATPSTPASPFIFAHLSETLGGITTIRTYDAVPRFAMKAMEHVDRNMTAYLTMISANRCPEGCLQQPPPPPHYTWR